MVNWRSKGGGYFFEGPQHYFLFLGQNKIYNIPNQGAVAPQIFLTTLTFSHFLKDFLFCFSQ
jgi:hypothetical protein